MLLYEDGSPRKQGARQMLQIDLRSDPSRRIKGIFLSS
jgi:hypothetical protein